MLRSMMLLLASVFSVTAMADDALNVLESRLRAVTPAPKGIFSAKETAQSRLRKIQTVNAAAANAPAAVCQVSRTALMGGRYMVSMDAQGMACRIADLSFPTLIGARHKIAELPTEKLTAADYLAWIDGRYDDVYNRVESMKVSFNAQEAATASWVAKIKFRDTPAGLMAKQALGAGGLPATFRASDLEVGQFEFAPRDKALLKQMIAESHDGEKFAFGAADPIEQLADNPGKLLEKIRFDWNDLRKVYEIALEGEFLPLKAPVTLVDFERPHKQAVEAIIRSTMGSLLLELTKLIPEPFTQSIVNVAVTDTFEFLDLMYADRMAQLEQNLRGEITRGPGASPLSAVTLDKALDISFGTRTNLIMDYMMAAMTGSTIRWTEVDRLGRLARYRDEKQREILMGQLNSRLVLDKKCDVERPWGPFAVCSQKGQKVAVYSLMSEHKLLFWNLGAPMIHDYRMASKIALLRGTSWLLSAVLRVYKLPMVGFLQQSLSNQLKGYAKAGLTDEAYLRTQLLAEKHNNGSLDAEREKMLSWLYIQNINPFLPKSETSENAVIRRNGGQ